MASKGKPKFKVGQVVCIKATKGFARISTVSQSDDETYEWMYEFADTTPWMYQSELRPLTAREKGEASR